LSIRKIIDKGHRVVGQFVCRLTLSKANLGPKQSRTPFHIIAGSYLTARSERAHYGI